MKAIYVTGLHRGGTHKFGENISKSNDMVNVDENEIMWDDLECAIKLPEKRIRRLNENGKPTWYYLKENPKLENGIVVQCPGLAHECETLSKAGKVYWITRDHTEVVTSMHNANIGPMAWHIMKGFRGKWPDDPIWSKLKYNGTEDVHNYFVGYYTILVRVKEYFFEKYLKQFAEKVKTEEQPYNDVSDTTAKLNPLRKRLADSHKKYIAHMDDVWQQLMFS